MGRGSDGASASLKTSDLPGSIYQQQGRSGYTVIVPYTDPVTGRRRTRSRTARDIGAANDVLVELNALTPGEHHEQVATPTTFRELAADWLTEKDPRFDRSSAPSGHLFTERPVDDATWRGYASEVKTHLVPTLGDLPLSSLTRARVQTFLQELPHRASELHPGQAISRSMVVKVYRRLASIVRYGRIAGLIDGDPMLGNPVPAPVRRSARHAAEVMPADRALSTAETDAVLAWFSQAYARHPAYRARFQLAAEAGLRQAEACGLTWDRVDLAGRLVVVHQQLVHEPHAHGCGPLDPQSGVTPCTLEERRRTGNRRAPQVSAYRCPQRTGGGWWIDQDTKSHQQRRVPLTQDLTDALRRLTAARQEPRRTQAERRAIDRSRARSRYPVEHADLVFTAERGGHISKSLDNTLWHRALDGAGVSSRGRTVHALRHTAATSWIEAGLTLPNVQVLLGHSSLQVLQRYYGSVQASRVAVADQLAEYLSRARAAN